MSDLISREAAIDALNEKCLMPVWCKVLVKKMLTDLPSEQKWKPVSERLPKKNSEYLVTKKDHITYERLIDIAYYGSFIHENNGFNKADDIVAWMPLPEPWRGDTYGKENAE